MEKALVELIDQRKTIIFKNI